MRPEGSVVVDGVALKASTLHLSEQRQGSLPVAALLLSCAP